MLTFLLAEIPRSPTPEPASFILIGLGLLTLAFVYRHRRKD
jgi:hypothetical protein